MLIGLGCSGASGPVQIFVVGPPRSGTTIVTQMLNRHERIRLYDEVDFLHAADFGSFVVGKLHGFLSERGAYDAYCACVKEVSGPVALNAVMHALSGPGIVWGEKNPLYATRIEALRQAFPHAKILFLLRDPREVVSSYLVHRSSASRAKADFWIKDNVTEALSLVERCLSPLDHNADDLIVLRYEDFIANPAGELNRSLMDWNLDFVPEPQEHAFAAPETVGDHQFFRHGSALPWKLGNLSPLSRTAVVKPRLDPQDPAWSKVDELARSLGYP